VVPAGFKTEFASIPRMFVWPIRRCGSYTRAVSLHDYLRSAKPVSRADADGLLRRAIQELGVSPLCWIMWAAVRAASLLVELISWLRGRALGKTSRQMPTLHVRTA